MVQRPDQKVGNLSRRQALFCTLSLAGGISSLPALARAPSPARTGGIVATNYPLAQSLVALGVSDFGLTNAWIMEQAEAGNSHLPDSVFDVGSSAEPNLELLADIHPSVIFHSSGQPPDMRILERVGPVVDIPIRFSKDEDSLTVLRKMLFAVADVLGRRVQAEHFYAELLELFSSVRSSVQSHRRRPILALDITWGRIFATWGRGSLFDCILDKIGLTNAITYRDRPVGWAYVSFQDLLAMKDVWGVHIGPIPEMTLKSPIWPLLPFVRENHLSVLPEERMYTGGLLTARSLTQSLGAALG